MCVSVSFNTESEYEIIKLVCNQKRLHSNYNRIH